MRCVLAATAMLAAVQFFSIAAAASTGEARLVGSDAPFTQANTANSGPVTAPRIGDVFILGRPLALQGRPMRTGPATGALAAGDRVTLSGSIDNGEGRWWYLQTPAGTGWLGDADLQAARVELPPVAPPPSTPVAPAPAPPMTADAAADPSPTTSAKTREHRAHGVIEVALDYGGDPLLELYYSDGSSQTIKAGQGLLTTLGFAIRPDLDMPHEIRATVGYKFTSSKASNADISFDRISWELTPTFYLTQKFWGGVGLVHHTGVKLDGDNLFPEVKFKAATGYSLQLGYSFVAVKYTVLSYETQSGGKIDANSVGALFTVKF